MEENETLEHRPRMQTQLVTDLSDSWRTARMTGLVHLTCNCGYSSGWVPRDEVPSPEEFVAQHPRLEPEVLR